MADTLDQIGRANHAPRKPSRTRTPLAGLVYLRKNIFLSGDMAPPLREAPQLRSFNVSQAPRAASTAVAPDVCFCRLSVAGSLTKERPLQRKSDIPARRHDGRF